MDHERRDTLVEASRQEGHAPAKPCRHSMATPASRGLARGEGQRLRVGVELDHRGSGWRRFSAARAPRCRSRGRAHGRPAGSRGLEQPGARAIGAEQPTERVVEAEEAVVTRGRDVVVRSVRPCVLLRVDGGGGGRASGDARASARACSCQCACAGTPDSRVRVDMVAVVVTVAVGVRERRVRVECAWRSRSTSASEATEQRRRAELHRAHRSPSERRREREAEERRAREDDLGAGRAEAWAART